MLGESERCRPVVRDQQHRFAMVESRQKECPRGDGVAAATVSLSARTHA